MRYGQSVIHLAYVNILTALVTKEWLTFVFVFEISSLLQIFLIVIRT